jgi:hypothetical protein
MTPHLVFARGEGPEAISVGRGIRMLKGAALRCPLLSHRQAAEDITPLLPWSGYEFLDLGAYTLEHSGYWADDARHSNHGS